MNGYIKRQQATIVLRMEAHMQSEATRPKDGDSSSAGKANAYAKVVIVDASACWTFHATHVQA